MKKKDSNDKHETPKSLFKRLLNLLDSEDDDDLEDYQPKTTINQIVTDKGREKIDMPQCKDDLYDVSIPQYKFPYEDYQIIGDTDEIDKVIRKYGMINYIDNIDVADITSTLSTDTLNYVAVGYGDNICNAVKQSIENLPILVTDVAKMLFQLLIPKNEKPDLSEIKLMLDLIDELPADIDVFWGVAFDESLTDKIKVILITSSK